MLVDSRIPNECSSPGWTEAPYDVSTLIGGYVYFNCRSSIANSVTTWRLDGRKEVVASSKSMIYNRNSSLRYGPVEKEDDGLAIGCLVTTEFGELPSSLGKITVKSERYACVHHLLSIIITQSTIAIKFKVGLSSM